MVSLYCALAAAISVPLVPLLYIKIIANAIYILVNNKREEFKGESIIKLFASIFFGPLVIVGALLIDVLALPNLLLKDEKTFEFKYQQMLDHMSKAQSERVIKLFTKLVYTN